MTENVPAVVMMGAEEARAETEAAKGDIVRGFERLANVRDREGWKALDYPTWDAYCSAELGWTRNYANKLIDHERFKGELEAAAGTAVPGLTERGTRQARSKDRRADTLAAAAEVGTTVPTEERPAAVERIVTGTHVEPEPPPEKRTATHRSAAFKVQFVDPDLTDLVNLAVIEQVSTETMIVRLALLQLAHVKDTGETPALVKTNGRRREREPAAAAPSNGDCPKHVASKPGLSGLVVCELCGLPRNRWAVAASTAGAGPKVERQRVEVESRLKK